MKRTYKALISILALASALCGCSKPEKEAVALAAPEPEIAVLGIDNVTIIWESVENAVSYEVLLNGSETIPATGNSCRIGDLTSGTSYSVKMKSIAPEGSSEWLDSDYGKECTFTTKGKNALSSPVLAAENLAADSFRITWSPVRNAGKYVWTLDGGIETETAETSVEFTDLTFLTQYTVKVKAVPSAEYESVSVESAWAELKVTTLDRSALSKPELKTDEVNTNGFTIKWEPVENASSYLYSINGAAPTSVTETFFTAEGLKASTQYTVSVIAVPSNDALYVQSAAAEIKVTTNPLIVLDTPVLKSESVLATEFTVKWTAVEHAASYAVTLQGSTWGTVTEPEVHFTGLSTETAYAVTVKALPDSGELETYVESAVAGITVTTKEGPSQDDKGGNLPDFGEDIIF